MERALNRLTQERARQDLPSVLSDPIRNFNGIPSAGAAGRRMQTAPRERRSTVQVVKSTYQVFDKSTGASVLGPSSIDSLWVGFGGVCQTNGGGDRDPAL